MGPKAGTASVAHAWGREEHTTGEGLRDAVTSHVGDNGEGTRVDVRRQRSDGAAVARAGDGEGFAPGGVRPVQETCCLESQRVGLHEAVVHSVQVAAVLCGGLAAAVKRCGRQDTHHPLHKPLVESP